jgi:hypothetical protein
VFAGRDKLLNQNGAAEYTGILCLKAEYVILEMPARKRDIVQFDVTLSAILPARRLLAGMFAWFMQSLARLCAQKHVVHTFRMTSGLAHMATVRQAPGTREATSSFWADFGKVMRFVNFNLGFGMAWAAKPQTCSHGVSHPKHVDNFLPHFNV